MGRVLFEVLKTGITYFACRIFSQVLWSCTTLGTVTADTGRTRSAVFAGTLGSMRGLRTAYTSQRCLHILGLAHHATFVACATGAANACAFSHVARGRAFSTFSNVSGDVRLVCRFWHADLGLSSYFLFASFILSCLVSHRLAVETRDDMQEA